MGQLSFNFADRNIFLMNRLYGAYVNLMLARKNEGGVRMISLARFDAFEVRLIEAVERPEAGELDFWIELYCHNTQSSLDSCRCRDLDEAEPLAEHLIAEARDLHASYGKSESSH